MSALPTYARGMVQTAVTWACRLISIFALGPLAWWLAASSRAADGSDHIPAVLSTMPALGLGKALGAALLAGMAGIVTARLVSLRPALFNAGAVLTWAAAGSGTVPDVVRIWPDGSVLARLAIEGVALGVPVLVSVALMVWAAGQRAVAGGKNQGASLMREPLMVRLASSPRAVLGELFGVPPRETMLAEPVSVLNIGLGVVVAVAGAVLASWLVAQNMLKGQTVAAAAAGGLFAGAGLVLLDYRLSAAVAMAGLCVVAAVSPLAGVLGHALLAAGKPFDAHVFSGALIAPARVLPIDWLAGGLLGLPMGLSLGSWLSENKYREQAVGA